jgi:hypothetical protein
MSSFNRRWTTANIIAFITLIVTIFAVIVTVTVPEVRSRFGLEQPVSSGLYTGRIANEENSPIRNAKITLLIQDKPITSYTDSEGIYQFTFDTEEVPLTAKVTVQAAGYAVYDRVVNITNKRIEEIRLEAMSSSESSLIPAPAIPSASASIASPQTSSSAGLSFRSSPSPPGISTNDNLESNLGIDYTPLQNLLMNNNWKSADVETMRLMLEIAKSTTPDWNRQGGNWIQGFIISGQRQNFLSCTDISTINQLWVKYSNGRFGFGVQLQIWRSVRQKLGWSEDRFPPYTEAEAIPIAYSALANRLGWRTNNSDLAYNNLTFSLTAPKGHLPAIRSGLTVGGRDTGWTANGVDHLFGLVSSSAGSYGSLGTLHECGL